jgi:hypothetical protein
MSTTLKFASPLPPPKKLCIDIKVKVKFSLEQATKAQRGSRGTALLFLYLWHYMRVGGQLHALAALPIV